MAAPFSPSNAEIYRNEDLNPFIILLGSVIGINVLLMEDNVCLHLTAQVTGYLESE